MNQHFLNLKAQVEALAEKVEALETKPDVVTEIAEVRVKVEELKSTEGLENKVSEVTAIVALLREEFLAMDTLLGITIERVEALEAKPAKKSTKGK